MIYLDIFQPTHLRFDILTYRLGKSLSPRLFDLASFGIKLLPNVVKASIYIMLHI